MPDKNDALEAAVAKVAAAQNKPLSQAKALAESEQAVRVAYSIIFNLVNRLGGGPVRIDRGDMLLPPNKHIVFKNDAEGNVHISIDTR